MDSKPLGLDEEDGEEEDDEEDEEANEDVSVDEMIEDEESSQAFLSETGSDVSTQPLQEPVPPCDVQMQSAIDSILQSAAPNSFYDSSAYSGRGYETNNPLNHHRSSSTMPSFGTHAPGQMSDPILDEAVKSILS